MYTFTGVEMISEAQKQAILELSREERLRLLELIADSLAVDPPPLSEAQKKLLDERIAAHRADPNRGSPLEEVEARLRARK
jgi:putative addiction module component (TIGR02574 family)